MRAAQESLMQQALVMHQELVTRRGDGGKVMVVDSDGTQRKLETAFMCSNEEAVVSRQLPK